LRQYIYHNGAVKAIRDNFCGTVPDGSEIIKNLFNNQGLSGENLAAFVQLVQCKESVQAHFVFARNGKGAVT